MATWGEVSKFKHGELEKMHLTWGDLQQMSFDELMKLAQLRLDQFQPKTEKEHILKSTFQMLLVKIASEIALSIAKEVDWLDVLRGIVQFFSDNF